MTAPPAEDTRDAADLSARENADLCAGCVKCCTYITVEVDKPRTPREYDQWLWAIMHEHVSLYVERPERWFLAVETRCTHLDPGGRCGIHGRHPVLCREYDPRECERRLPLADVRAWFHTAAELERWLARERPAHHRALLAWRRDMPPAPPRADVHAEARDREALITIAEPRAAGRAATPVPARSGTPAIEAGEPVSVRAQDDSRARGSADGRARPRGLSPRGRPSAASTRRAAPAPRAG